MDNIKNILITTSGVGSRLGNLTKYTNKALLRVGNKPVISHIIDSYPDNVNFVLTLGYYGEQVEEYLNLAYPHHNFTYIQVSNYSGPTSSLVYSMQQAKEVLSTPFVYHSSDTMISDSKQNLFLKGNLILGKKSIDTTNYASFNVNEKNVVKIFGKGMLNAPYTYVGVSKIEDFATFWKSAEEVLTVKKYQSDLSDVDVMQNMLEKGYEFNYLEVDSWLDTGSTYGLEQAKKKYENSFNILEKENESIFFIAGDVIKFFYDSETVKQRVDRANYLKDLTPKITGFGTNFYKYEFVDGDAFARSRESLKFTTLLNWLSKNLWRDENKIENSRFKKDCLEFYETKTENRIQKFYEINSISDEENIINGIQIPKLSELFQQVDFQNLSNGIQSKFHGDLVLDNIIETENGFTLIDWRQNFGNSKLVGDRYYDFSKLNHSLNIDHEIINKNLFFIKKYQNKVEFDILIKESRLNQKAILKNYLERNNSDYTRVQTITALIWLNMSSLHSYPFSLFLYYYGKYNLWKILQN